MSLEPCTPTFPSLPTELLILILSYLPVVELWTVQRTCRRIHNIVAESAHLQYVLRTQLNGVDGLFPPDRPFSERLELLRCHENAWDNLQLKPFYEFASPRLDRHFLQDGYIIYNRIAESLQYGYVDLLSITPKEDLRWVHISREDLRHPLCVVFAVDHNLAVVLRYASFLITPPAERNI
jgi:F-box-like